jgi:hypothetical protein
MPASGWRKQNCETGLGGITAVTERCGDMKSTKTLIVALIAVPLLAASPCRAQTETKTTDKSTAASPETDAQKKNLQAYVDLLRKNVRQEKAEIMGAVMVLSADDAAKFWPIYSEYDVELTKLNDQRVENIKEYARTYNEMSDEKADELIRKSLAYQKQRAELLARTYDRVKQAVGAITAARFAQVEHQLLLIIDLQIASSLPVVEQGS